MIEEAFYSWIWDGLIMGFGSAILVSVILYIFATWIIDYVVGFNNILNSMLFVSIPFLAATIIGLLTLNWGLGFAILLMSLTFTIAMSELFR